MFRSARLTRRQLLKLGVVAAGMATADLLVAKGVMAEEFVRGGRSVSRTTGAMRRAVPSNCAHCAARCGILGFVEEDKLVKIEGNPRDPNSQGRLCARGHAGINRLYDPDRVLFPMARAGRRGEGKWVRLSWEQAYDTLQERLQELQTRDPESLIFHAGTEVSSLLASRFVAAAGSKSLIDEVRLREASRETANRLTLGTRSEVVDLAHTRHLLNFGSNPYETHAMYLPFVQRLVDARMSGAKLITFDPRLSLTAGRSDEWYPIMPGTDGLVALAMANVVVQQNLHNRQFLSRWTDLSTEQLAKQLAPYTPEAAERASGIRADDLRRVATEFAHTRPAVAFAGGGLGQQKGAVDTQRAVILLNALVGSVGVSGGYCPAPTYELSEPDPVPPPLPDSAEAIQRVEALLQGKGSSGLYLTCLANPAYSWPNSQAFRDALLDEKRVAYLVAIDTNLTETSALADLVLPASTYLESWGLESPPAHELVPYVALRQPIVRPRGESLSVDDILLTLGTRLGEKGSRYFPFPTVQSYLDAVLAKLPGLSAAGGLSLLREQGVWYDPAASPRHYAQGESFSTPSGKLEFGAIAAETAAGDGQTSGVSTSSGSSSPGELTLIGYRPNVHFGDYSANCWWLSEIDHDNALLINPVTAQQRGIKQGQQVKVISSVSTIQVKVRITQGIHPQVVALANGFGHEGVGRIARAEAFQSEDPMTPYIWWTKQGRGVNVSALLSGQDGGPGRGLVMADTRVRVEAMG